MSGEVYLRSPSGRTWKLGESRSDGRELTAQDVERIARDLGFQVICNVVTGCERPALGWLSPIRTLIDGGVVVLVPAHFCRQCAEHGCELRRFLVREALS